VTSDFAAGYKAYAEHFADAFVEKVQLLTPRSLPFGEDDVRWHGPAHRPDHGVNHGEDADEVSGRGANTAPPSRFKTTAKTRAKNARTDTVPGSRLTATPDKRSSSHCRSNEKTRPLEAEN